MKSQLLFDQQSLWSDYQVLWAFLFFRMTGCHMIQMSLYGHSNYQIGPNRTKSDQIGVNRTKSEIPSTKSGTFFGLAFFWCWYIENWILTQIVLMLMWPAVNTRTSSEWSTKDLVRVANYSISSLGLTDMLCIATLQLTAIDNDDEVGR